MEISFAADHTAVKQKEISMLLINLMLELRKINKVLFDSNTHVWFVNERTESNSSTLKNIAGGVILHQNIFDVRFDSI